MRPVLFAANSGELLFTSVWPVFCNSAPCVTHCQATRERLLLLFLGICHCRPRWFSPKLLLRCFRIDSCADSHMSSVTVKHRPLHIHEKKEKILLSRNILKENTNYSWFKSELLNHIIACRFACKV